MVTDPNISRRFYDRALKPLLGIAKKHRSAIFAWDIFNEPEWVTTDWHPYRVKGLPVAAQQMRQFIEGTMNRVRSQDFKATIGFARIETIYSTKLYADYNQFHHYATREDKRYLPQNKFDKRWPGIVGEFASSLSNDHWPELSDDQTVYDRLKQIEKMGYPLALIWSAIANDDHTSWGEAEEGIKKYLGK